MEPQGVLGPLQADVSIWIYLDLEGLSLLNAFAM
jgi:hypothetical protein